MFPLRSSTLIERKNYYSKEFNPLKVRRWFSENKLPYPQIMAMDLGSETKIITNKEKIGKMIFFRSNRLKERFSKVLPEDVYYNRNTYKDVGIAMKNLKSSFGDRNFLGQELAFDIDADNFECSCKKICGKCLHKAIVKSIKLAHKLEEKFRSVGLVYSGRGMHVHVFDKGAFMLSIKEREALNKRFRRYGIDPWVSRGRIRLIRLPYSLNGLVSRIVTPITLEEAYTFEPDDALPKSMQ